MRWIASGLYLVACALIGSAVAQYAALAEVGEDRGLSTSLVVRESLARLDLVHASVGLLAGLTSLVALGWVRRGQ
ncbi:hypothetical protein CFI00_22760 [Nocardioides sp. S5]|uniref:hypothetical protein n=1 Tax=Nocardioides sp. S5 TaxID=2017486 RepID=UPI001A8D4501|nr:hypothetical protein [Nocardioides sp. S5]QSR33278.1 hypothetical protein CFI00_22760 [Nocardioides sp. S5]